MTDLLQVILDAWTTGFGSYTSSVRPVLKTRRFYHARHQYKHREIPGDIWLIGIGSVLGMVFTFGLLIFAV